MNIKYKLLVCLCYFLGWYTHINAQNLKPNWFVCSYNCSNAYSSLKTNCVGTSIVREKPVPSENVNPYVEFDSVIAAISKERNNPFPLTYIFEQCKDVCNAASMMLDTVQYIFYNQKFLDDTRVGGTKKMWAVRAIIAHEIGHHILGHTNSGTVDPNGRRRQELRADYFSAFVIKHFGGASLQDALSGIQLLDPATYTPRTTSEENNSNYPTLEHRAQAITEAFAADPNNQISIAMFKNIDSVALASFIVFGKSIILRIADKEISRNNLAEALIALNKLLQMDLSESDKQLLSKAQRAIVSMKPGNSKIETDTWPDINPEKEFTDDEIKRLEDLYNKIKNSNLDDDIRKARDLQKQINDLKAKRGY